MEIQRRTYGVLQSDALDRTFAEILSELRAVAPPGAPEARVHATPDPAFSAFATPDGYIFLSFGVLRSIQSRDELAALIAHEYAHVLRGHSKPTQGSKMLKSLSGASNLYLAQRWGSEADLDDSDYVRQVAAYGVAMEALQSGVIPSRTRKQEAEADAIGVDLLVKAGYNPTAMMDLLSRMESWERAQDLAYEKQKTEMIKISESAQAHAAKGNFDDAAGYAIGAGLSNLFAAGSNAVGDGFRKARRKHASPEQRSDDVVVYLEKTHPDAERPELRPLPWHDDSSVLMLFEGVDKTHSFLSALAADDVPTFSRLAGEIKASPVADTAYARYALLQVFSTREGRAKSVAKVSEELVRPDSLFPSHFLVLDLLRQRGSSKEQVAALQQSQKLLGDPPELLPYAVGIHRRAGDRVNMDNAMKRCLGQANNQLIAACQAAAS
jgi:Zn-dependent protease with chaperone function